MNFTFYWIKPQTKPFTYPGVRFIAPGSSVPEEGKTHPICSSVSFVLFHLDLIDWATNRQYWFGHKILIRPLWNILKDLLTMKLMALQVLLSSSMQGTWKFKGKHDTYRWYFPLLLEIDGLNIVKQRYGMLKQFWWKHQNLMSHPLQIELNMKWSAEESII